MLFCMNLEKLKQRPYNSGDKVWYQNEDKSAWLGPVRVIVEKGNIVWVIAGGTVKKVAKHKIQPYDVGLDDEVLYGANSGESDKLINCVIQLKKCEILELPGILKIELQNDAQLMHMAF